jgi:lipopolysaccharide transport system ATP-binding protein
MRGRVASLLEVGTGFHPELTGRENIYLNGAILGMSQIEIRSKFDEIVDFAGVEKFLDTPVKRYSSGMYVRLAFAVAAHLEPEILVIDEVLAVGDAEFQKKCLGKMEEVTKKDGRTILFVSHNLPSVQSLCKKTVLLENGKVKKIGPTNDVIDAYLNDTSTQAAAPAQSFQLEAKGNKGDIRFTEITLSNFKGSGSIKSDDGLKITLDYDSTLTSLADVRVIISIVSDTTQQILLRMDSAIAAQTLKDPLKPHGQIVCQTGPINLLSGRYLLNLDLLVGDVNKLHMESVSPFEVETDIKKYNFKAYPDKYATDHLVTYNFKQAQ